MAADKSFLDRSDVEIGRDRVEDNVRLMSLQAKNADQELLRKALKDLQLSKERYEDSLGKFKQLAVTQTAEEFAAVQKAAMTDGKVAHDIQVKCQQYMMLAFSDGPEIAHRFADSHGSLSMTAEQNKRLREIRKEVPKSARAVHADNTHDSYRSGQDYPRKRAFNFEEQQYKLGLIKKGNRWAPNVDRCNKCDRPGHRQNSCPLGYTFPPPRSADPTITFPAVDYQSGKN